MKKLILLLSIVALSVVAKAQFSVGGTFGFNLNATSTHYAMHDNTTATFKSPNDINFFVAPRISYGLYDNFKCGIKGGFGMTRNREYNYTIFPDPNNNPQKDKITRFTWAAGAFARFNVFTWDYFTAFVEATIGYGSTTGDSVFYIAQNRRETVDLPHVNQLFLSIVPGVTYDFTDKISAELTANVLGFAYSYFWAKSVAPIGDVTTQRLHDTHIFNTNLNIPFNPGIFTIGINYHLY